MFHKNVEPKWVQKMKNIEGMHEAQETKEGRVLVRADSNEDAMKVFWHVVPKLVRMLVEPRRFFQTTLTHLNSGLSAGTAQVLQMRKFQAFVMRTVLASVDYVDLSPFAAMIARWQKRRGNIHPLASAVLQMCKSDDSRLISCFLQSRTMRANVQECSPM